jgi:hypothetical protein
MPSVGRCLCHGTVERTPSLTIRSCFGELSNILGTLTVPFVLRLTWSANGLLFSVLDDVF